MIVLAFDQAYSGATGWAVFSGHDLVDYGKFETGGNLKLFNNHVAPLLATHNPDRIYYEGIYNNNNANTFKRLAQVQGALLSLCEDAEEVYPTTWRSVLKLRARGRTAQKQEAQAYVLEHFGIKVVQDVADAILIGYSQVSQEINFE